MALTKQYMLPNGIPVSYHRIERLEVMANGVCGALVKSYIDKESREREKQRLEEISTPPYSTEIGEQYVYARVINIPFDGELSIEYAYAYLKTTDEFFGAEDDGDLTSDGYYEVIQGVLENAKSLAECSNAVNDLTDMVEEYAADTDAALFDLDAVQANYETDTDAALFELVDYIASLEERIEALEANNG